MKKKKKNNRNKIKGIAIATILAMLPVATLHTILSKDDSLSWEKLVKKISRLKNPIETPQTLAQESEGEGDSGGGEGEGGNCSGACDGGDAEDTATQQAEADAAAESEADYQEEVDTYLVNSCFTAGTKITLADGSVKNIEDVKIGDVLKSWDGEIEKPDDEEENLE